MDNSESRSYMSLTKLCIEIWLDQTLSTLPYFLFLFWPPTQLLRLLVLQVQKPRMSIPLPKIKDSLSLISNIIQFHQSLLAHPLLYFWWTNLGRNSQCFPKNRSPPYETEPENPHPKDASNKCPNKKLASYNTNIQRLVSINSSFNLI